MKITLDTVRNTLRSAFGRDSFVASFINRVEESPACPTASIDIQGVLRYNPEFTASHIGSNADLFCLIAHEMMHPMFGHFIYRMGQLENVAADSIINAVLSRFYAAPSGKGSLFRNFYKNCGVEGLLRPGSAMGSSRYAWLYASLYGGLGHHAKQGGRLSTGEVITALRVLTPKSEVEGIALLGGHGTLHGEETADALSPEQRSAIASDLKKAAKAGASAGQGDALQEFFLEVLQSQSGLKRSLLERYLTRSKVDRFKQHTRQSRPATSPVPVHPSKRDLVLLACGTLPLRYHNRLQRDRVQHRGLAVYLDVSGSVNTYLPKIIGVLKQLSSELMTVFLFSNKVVEVSFDSLLQGRVQTTYGTDFDCVAESILEQGLDKAVVITDGIADMKKENQALLKHKGVGTLTLLFGALRVCPVWGTVGEVMSLDDAIDR